jgi:hypothetical protein
VEQRRKGLQTYLEQLSLIPEIAKSEEFALFFDPNKPNVRSLLCTPPMRAFAVHVLTFSPTISKLPRLHRCIFFVRCKSSLTVRLFAICIR